MLKETKRGVLGALSGTGVWLLPAWGCPVCLAAFAATMSAVGLGFLASEVVLTPLMAILLGVAVFSLAYSARKRRRYGPLLVGTLGAAILAASKFSPGQPWLSYAGLAPLLGASLWNVRIGASLNADPPTGFDNGLEERG